MTQRANKKQQVETTNHLIILSIPNQQAGFPPPIKQWERPTE